MSILNFKSDTTRYHQANALFLAEAARLAYAGPAVISERAPELGFKKVRYLQRRETACYVAADSEAILVAFRGTQAEHLRDWMIDFDARLEDIGTGAVHHGFLRALEFVWKDLEATLREFKDNRQALWFTGHGLGGAVATLAVHRIFVDRDEPFHGLYTFGSPRVGDRQFARIFNLECKDQCFRLVNHDDVVSRVPMRSMRYSHVGSLRYFDSTGQEHEDAHYWYRFLEQREASIDDWLRPDSQGLLNHAIDAYVEVLAENVKATHKQMDRA